MRLETFCNTLGYLPLQRHLLAVPTHTLEDAVKAGNEYLQIKPANERGSTNVRQIEEEEGANPTEKALTTLMKTMQKLAEKVGQLPNRLTRCVCWECSKEDHPKRNCFHLKTPQPTDQAVPGNGQGPQQ